MSVVLFVCVMSSIGVCNAHAHLLKLLYIVSFSFRVPFHNFLKEKWRYVCMHTCTFILKFGSWSLIVSIHMCVTGALLQFVHTYVHTVATLKHWCVVNFNHNDVQKTKTFIILVARIFYLFTFAASILHIEIVYNALTWEWAFVTNTLTY